MKYDLISGYRSKLTLIETEVAIKEIKDFFERELAGRLSLTRVSAPLFVRPETGLNDNLNGIERPVAFDVKDLGKSVEVVQSLAKWKRMALAKYGFNNGNGLYTDMNAIRRDEILDSMHSVYVDQWDWEKIIAEEDRNEDKLKQTVVQIYGAMQETEKKISSGFPSLRSKLPRDIRFITTQELEDMYPELTPKQREDAAVRESGAVFLLKIGKTLRSGTIHDGRAPDYDDWELNGDLLLYYDLFDRAFEISSMGIRVDGASLRKQLEISGCEDRMRLPFHRMVLNAELPYTIGGGIGQSRLCMYFLEKAHIGEVQASVWPDDMTEDCGNAGIFLL